MKQIIAGDRTMYGSRMKMSKLKEWSGVQIRSKFQLKVLLSILVPVVVFCVITNVVISALLGRQLLEKRREIIQGAQPSVMLSVHQNYFPSDTSRGGGQAFYRMGSTAGQRLARSIQKQLNTLSQKEHSALTGDYFMLECTNYTSVIVECGFLSNAEDEALLTDKGFQEKLAYAIFCGTLAFLS